MKTSTKTKKETKKEETSDDLVIASEEEKALGLTSILDKELITSLEESDSKTSDWWRASELGLCMRKALFRRQGVKGTQPTPRELKKMKVGELFHQYMQNLTKKYNLSVEQELFLEDKEFEYRGKIDDLIKINDEILIVEYKSEHSKSFDWREKSLEKIAWHHKIQGMSYAHFLIKSGKYPNIKKIRWIYISKDDFRMDELEMEYTEDYGHFIEKILKKLSKYFKNKKLPPPIKFREDKEFGWQCAILEKKGVYRGKYKPTCQFFEHCRKLHGDYNELELIPNYNN